MWLYLLNKGGNMNLADLLNKPNIIELNNLTTSELRELSQLVTMIEAVKGDCTKLTEEHLQNIKDNGAIINDVLAYRASKEVI